MENTIRQEFSSAERPLCKRVAERASATIDNVQLAVRLHANKLYPGENVPNYRLHGTKNHYGPLMLSIELRLKL